MNTTKSNSSKKEYENRLAIRALRRLATGKTPTPKGKKAMLNYKFITEDNKITDLGLEALQTK